MSALRIGTITVEQGHTHPINPRLSPLRALAMCVLLSMLCATLCGCDKGEVTVGYKPPFVPVEIRVDQTGKVSIGTAASISTPLGVFTLEGSAPLNDPDEPNALLVVVRRRGVVVEQYKVTGKQELRVTIQGNVEFTLGAKRVTIDVDRLPSGPGGPPLEPEAGRACSSDSACGALRCISGVCGVKPMAASCKSACVVHNDARDSKRSSICTVRPGTAVVALAVGERKVPENWPVVIVGSTDGCPRRAFMHPAVLADAQ